MMKDLLVFRLLILNTIGFVLLAVAGISGFVTPMLSGGWLHTGLIYVIVILFLGGLASVFTRARKVSAAMNDIKSGKTVAIEGTKFLEKNGHIEDICTWLVTLSLLGNVVGFYIAIAGKHDLSSSEGLLALAAQFMDGMAVAFETTIAGIIFALWLDINRRVLKTAAVCLVQDSGS